MFDPFIDILPISLLALSLVAAVIAVVARFVPIARVGRLARQQEELPASPENAPLLSVVVYTFSPEEKLKEYLDMLMQQDYPNYEVILVNDGNIDVTKELSERIQSLYPHNLYITFIPTGSHNLSRRKLALTLGIKAAKGEVVLTTTSNCRIPSTGWLSAMMLPFQESSSTEVVLGYSHIEFSEMTGGAKWYRQFDDLLTSCQWLGAAIAGNPYRGDGENLAFKRRLFFEQKGYSRSIHLVNGDDDLFVNEIADDFNTEVMLAPESILSVDWGEASNRMYADLKERYQFTATLLPFAPFLRAGLGSSMQWLAVGAAVAAALISLPNLFTTAVGTFILLALFTVEGIIYDRTARRLGASSIWASLPLFLLWHPIGNLFFRLRHRNHRKKNFTFA